MPPTLTFLSWSREKLGDLATATVSGRARAQTTLTLAGTDAAGAPTSAVSRTLSFLLAGPADVAGLQPGAVTARFPVPGTIDAESDKSAHVELAEPTLPWRYSPAGNPAAGTGALHPWLALVVGVEDDEVRMAGGQATLSAAVQLLHPLGGPGPFPWAHVQVDDAGRRVARVVSGRPLDGGQEYLAVLVPAYAADGAKAWAGTAPVTLPVLDHWRFRTATPAGGFRDLAEKLEPGQADPDTGRAPLDYPRIAATADLEVRGALAPINSSDAALDPAVGADLEALATPARDAEGRPIVGLPRYGDAWTADPSATTWGATLNEDPRHRGVAGLGLELGIRLQEELAEEAAAHAGALDVAAQRIRDLVLGLAVSRRLWERRMPQDPLRRLWVLGPALGRLATPAGLVGELATADDRALPRGLFSSAARRILRPGPARTALLEGGPPDPRDVVGAVNSCPEPPRAEPEGIDLGELGPDFDERRRRVLERGLDLRELEAALAELDLGPLDGELRELAETLRKRLQTAAAAGEPSAPYAAGLGLLAAALAVDQHDFRAVGRLLAAIRALLERFRQVGEESSDLVDLLDALEEPEDRVPPCRPVDLDRLAEGVDLAFDPRGPDGPARVRVLSTVEGLDPAQPLAPVEVCVGLSRPVWRDLEGEFVEWLLPGVGDLPEDSVIALETNPTFTDALLAGYNTHLLAELRWRNLRAAAGCTPLRVFWERADTGSGARIDDIVGIAGWDPGSTLGDASHRPGGAAARDLVVVVRGQLFLRYPRTLVYLTSARHGGTVDFGADPDPAAPRLLPTFQGRIGTDVTFFGFQGLPAAEVGSHWLVFEEPPAGYRFYNAGEVAVPAGSDGAAWADQAFADPIRVLIAGGDLAP